MTEPNGNIEVFVTESPVVQGEKGEELESRGKRESTNEEALPPEQVPGPKRPKRERPKRRAQLQDTLDISGMKRGVLADEVVEELQARGGFSEKAPKFHFSPGELSRFPHTLNRYLDQKVLQETGFRLVVLERAVHEPMPYRRIMDIVDQCMNLGIFVILRQFFPEMQADLMSYLQKHSGVVAEYSKTTDYRHICLGDYRHKLLDANEHSSITEAEELRTFTIKNPKIQHEEIAALNGHPFLNRYLPNGERSGFPNKPVGETQFGPFTFGGDKVRPIRNATERTSPRAGKGASSAMHLDGMGSYAAIGILRDGKKSITAVEVCDADDAFKLAGFNIYGLPGGEYVNPFITEEIKERWKSRPSGSVRFATFELFPGDCYFIPPGQPHEFLNAEPSLSIAWNILPTRKDTWNYKASKYVLEKACQALITNFRQESNAFKELYDHIPWAYYNIHLS